MAKHAQEGQEQKGPSQMLGVYFGKHDDDLVEWKESCQHDYDVAPSAFAKDAIREKIVRAKGHENDSISLKQAVRLLMKHSEVFEEILSYVKGGVVSISAPPSETRQLLDQQRTPQRADYVSSCKELGWGS